MTSSPTLGFSIAPQDRPRLERLVERYAHGNRSEWLRQALDLFERMELTVVLGGLQARGEERTAARGVSPEDLAARLSGLLASPSSEIVESARRLVIEAVEVDFDGSVDWEERASPAAERFWADLGGAPQAPPSR